MGRSTGEDLANYWGKRDFSKTPEPAGHAGRARSRNLQFVIQKHAARRLHYDFRLELAGTLKSWAIPKGPSLDPADKRLAVHVEDHPLEYAHFEGTIPDHQYGAGKVVVWDRGTWIPVGDPHAGYANGNLKFELRGEKLHGRFALVRMKQWSHGGKENWLLVKERDAEARPGEGAVLTETRPESVLSGRTLEDITAGRQASARVPRKARGARSDPTPTTGAAAAPKSEGHARDARRRVAAKSAPQSGPRTAASRSRTGKAHGG